MAPHPPGSAPFPAGAPSPPGSRPVPPRCQRGGGGRHVGAARPRPEAEAAARPPRTPRTRRPRPLPRSDPRARAAAAVGASGPNPARADLCGRCARGGCGGGSEVRAEATAERPPRSPSSSPALPAARRGWRRPGRAPCAKAPWRAANKEPPPAALRAGCGARPRRGEGPLHPPLHRASRRPLPAPRIPLPARLRRRHLPRRGEGARGPRDGGGGWSGRRWCPPLPPALCVRGSARCALA